MKRLLKKIFPLRLLKNAFLVYNRVKAGTTDRLFFSTYKVPPAQVIVRESKNPFLESGVDVTGFTPAVREGFSRWTNPRWTQDQYLIEIVNPAILIEGETGWAMISPNRLIYESLGFARAPYVHKPAVGETILRQRAEVDLPAVISLRDTGEENYFHFFNDIIAKLYFLEDQGRLHPEASLVVSKKLAEKKYFRYFCGLTRNRNYKWYVQGTEWIRTRHIVLCKPYTHTKTYLLRSANLFSAGIRPGAPRKVFLTRARQTHRFIENEHEVEQYLSRQGYEKIDAAQLSMENQIQIFAAATHVVAVHGAGLTNMMFRYPNALNVVEIFHDNEYLPFHYIMLASMLGFSYRPVWGKRAGHGRMGGFRVDLPDLRRVCEMH